MKHLSKEEVKKAIHFGKPSRVPLFIHFWIFPDSLPEMEPALEEIMGRNICDFGYFMPHMPGYEGSPIKSHPEYRWMPETSEITQQSGGLDSQRLIEDWEQLEEILKSFPDPNIPQIFQKPDLCRYMEADDIYRVTHFHYLFYERLWSFRGMENALMDLCLYKDEVKKIFARLCEFYKVIIRRSRQELNSDALFVTDDLGTQNSLMFSPTIFREIFKPFYKEIIDECHRNGMDFWLHSCGNITEILDDLIEIGVDVIHPIQKYAMEVAEIAHKYSGKICFWCGLDMQEILPNGTSQMVREEVRKMIDLFDVSEGGLILGLGNGFTKDVPMENLEAFFEEALTYGAEHRGVFANNPV